MEPRTIICRLPAIVVTATIIPLLWSAGCRIPPSSGTPISATPLGSIVDDANRKQEDNAEQAKFIVYMHEFELNQPFKIPLELARTEEFQGVPAELARGFRLTPYGQDHVIQIGRMLQNRESQIVVVERSNTSKQWTSIYRYPVHWNPELDEHRRQIVVTALRAMGIEQANELVHVAPAFPEGLHANEAIQAYNGSHSSGGGGGNGGGGGGQQAGGSGIGMSGSMGAGGFGGY